MSIRLILVDDHSVARRGLHSYLASFPDIEVVGEAASGEAALANLERWLPDVAVMDLLMPGGMDGWMDGWYRNDTPDATVVAAHAGRGIDGAYG